MTVPFKRFLGYDMGPDRNLVVNPDQAKIVKRIYGLFLQGKAPHTIAKTLTDEPETFTAARNKKWNPSTIKSILTNEKYRGMPYCRNLTRLTFLPRRRKLTKVKFPSITLKATTKPLFNLRYLTWCKNRWLYVPREIIVGVQPVYSQVNLFAETVAIFTAPRFGIAIQNIAELSGGVTTNTGMTRSAKRHI